MKIIDLEEYRRARSIQELSDKQKNLWPAKERLMKHFLERLRTRLRAKLRENMNQSTEEDV